MLVKSPQLSSLALLRKAAAAGWAAHALLCSTISLENRIQLFRVLSLPQASIHLMLCPPTAHTCTHPHTHIHTHTHTYTYTYTYTEICWLMSSPRPISCCLITTMHFST